MPNREYALKMRRKTLCYTHIHVVFFVVVVFGCNRKMNEKKNLHTRAHCPLKPKKCSFNYILCFFHLFLFNFHLNKDLHIYCYLKT